MGEALDKVSEFVALGRVSGYTRVVHGRIIHVRPYTNSVGGDALNGLEHATDVQEVVHQGITIGHFGQTGHPGAAAKFVGQTYMVGERNKVLSNFKSMYEGNTAKEVLGKMVAGKKDERGGGNPLDRLGDLGQDRMDEKIRRDWEKNAAKDRSIGARLGRADFQKSLAATHKTSKTASKDTVSHNHRRRRGASRVVGSPYMALSKVEDFLEGDHD